MATIVIADDDPQIQSMLKIFLEKSGYTTHVAGDGQACLTLIAKHTPDLLLLDVNMPGLDGFDVLKFIDNVRKKFGLPVIVITALNAKNNVLKAAQLQIQDFIVKPLDLPDLKQRIEMQLYRLVYNDLRLILKNLGPVQSEMKHPKAIQQYLTQGWEPYAAAYNNLTLCVLLHPPIQKDGNPTESECLSGVTIFAKFSKRWKRVWPAGDSMEVPDVSSAA